MSNSRNLKAEKELFKAIQADNLEDFKKQLASEFKSAVNLQLMGDSLVYLAAQECSYKIVRFLVENGADITTADNSFDNKNALSAVCIYDGNPTKNSIRLTIAKLLLDNGIDVNKGIGKDYTALHYAALYQFDEMVEFLLKNKAKVDATDSVKRTPLGLLLEQREASSSARTVKILLENGADINASGATFTPWEQACAFCPNLKPLLMSYMQPSETLSKCAQEAKSLALLATNLGFYGRNNIKQQVQRVEANYRLPGEEYNQAAKRFDFWMEKYGYNNSSPKGEEKDNEKLIKWLSADYDAIHVKDSEQFGALINAIQKLGYFTDVTVARPDFIEVQQGVSESRKEVFRMSR